MSEAAQIWVRRLKIGLSPLAKILSYELAFRADDDENEAWPTVRRLSDDTEVPIRTVSRGLEELKAAGVIRDTGRRAGNGAVIWRLMMKLEVYAKLADHPEVCQNGSGSVAKMAEPPSAKMADISFTILQTSLPTITSAREPPPTQTKPVNEPEGFAEVYRAYPNCKRKVGSRSEAMRAYAKALKCATPAQILAGIRAYPWNTDRDFIPAPEVWLNKKRWLVDPKDMAAPRQTTPTMGSPW